MSGDNISPRPADAYWASKTGDELASQVNSRFVEYQRGLERRGLLDLYSRTSSIFYGYDPGTDSFADWIKEAGEDGEFLHLHVNEIASLLRHQQILTTSDQLELDARATNDSPEAEAQAALGDAIIAYYREEGGLEERLVEGCERMLRHGTAYIVQLWDAFAGEDAGVEDVGADGAVMTDASAMSATPPVAGPEAASMGGIAEALQSALGGAEGEPSPSQALSQRVTKAGDVVHAVYGPLDVAVDLGCRSLSNVRWHIVRERDDRWDLIAKYPEHRDYLLSRPPYFNDEYTKVERGTSTPEADKGSSDQIHKLRCLHAKCAALPDGLEVVVCGEKVLGPALPLAYKRSPVHPMVAEEIEGLPLGNSINWSLLGPQAALNAAVSNGITAMDAGSVPKYAIPRQTNVQVEDLTPNAKAVYYDANMQLPQAGFPTLMPTPQLQDAHIKGEDVARARLERISGVNSVVRGESAGKSGADNALLDAKAIQYMGPYSRAFAKTGKSVALGLIEVHQVFASHERMVGIVGEDEAPSLEYFTGDDLSAVRQIDVELGDPVMRTMQGRRATADQLLEKFPDQITPQQYIAFMSSGRLEPLYKAQRNQMRLIRSENAKLSKGEPQPVLAADCHEDHIKEHLALLSTPTVRREQTISAGVLAHVMEHMQAWYTAAPALLVATGQRPPPPMGPADMMGGGMPPDGGPPPEEGGPPAGPPSDANGSGPAPGRDGVNLPSMPKNAATGQPAPPPPNGAA